MSPTSLYLFCKVNVTTLYFDPAMVSDFTLALFAMAPLMKPKGLSQYLNWISHGESDEMYSFCVWSVPPWTRTNCTWDAVAAKSISRIYVFTRTTGHATFGLMFCPMPELEPMPEN